MMKKISGLIAGLFLIIGLTQSGYAADSASDYDRDLSAATASEYTEDDGCTWIDVYIPLPSGTIIHRTVCIPN